MVDAYLQIQPSELISCDQQVSDCQIIRKTHCHANLGDLAGLVCARQVKPQLDWKKT